MTAVRRRTRPLTVRVDQLRHSGVLYGPVRVVAPAIKRVGCSAQYDNRLHAFKVPLQRLDDVMVAIELDGHHVQLGMASW